MSLRTVSIFCSLYATLGRKHLFVKELLIILYMGYTDSRALPTWSIKACGCRLLWPPLLHIWCYYVQQLTRSSNLPGPAPSCKGEEQGLWWYLFIHCCCCWSSKVRKAYRTQEKKKKMVQPNLPIRSAYSNKQQTYLSRNFFFKKWDEREGKTKWCFD